MKKILLSSLSLVVSLLTLDAQEWNTPGNWYANSVLDIWRGGKVGIGTWYTPDATSQWYGTDPAPYFEVTSHNALASSPGSYVMRTSFTGNCGNMMREVTWLRRVSQGTAWQNTSLHNGIAVDNAFLSPGSDTKTWWERDPNADIQAWGNGATRHMQLNQGKLIIKGWEPNAGIGWNTNSAIRICNGYGLNYGQRAELQFGLDETNNGNLAVIGAAYVNSGGGNIGGELVFGTRPNGSNLVERMRLTHDGSLLIRKWDGVTINFKVDQWGFVKCREVQVLTTQIFPDYVFSDTYQLPTLAGLKKYIEQNKHLPGFEPGTYYEENGIKTSEMLIKHQEKIEELTLYIIELKEELETLKAKSRE
jgi:hypothetical protein